MSRASIGSGSHGGDVGRFEDEKSGRGRAASGGRHIENDGNRGVRNLLDNFASRFDKTPGCIDLDQYSLSAAALSFVDGAGYVFFSNGLNGVVNDNLENFGAGDGAENENSQHA